MNSPSIWVIGPIAWDTVLYVPQIPTSGRFLHATSHQERPGGQGFNVASGIRSANLPVNLVGYVGNDSEGSNLKKAISESGLSAEYIQTFSTASPHVTILVEESGERTMIGMEKNLLAKVSSALIPFAQGDIVVWPFWLDAFFPMLQEVREKCTVVIGSNSLQSQHDLAGDVLVVSRSEVQHPESVEKLKIKFSKVVITDGANGSKLFQDGKEFTITAMEINVADSTGAGDSFLAGVVLSQYENRSASDMLRVSTIWAGLTTANQQSNPVLWKFVSEEMHTAKFTK
jgi:sugar/nucleoside kinase (ribokinase family)